MCDWPIKISLAMSFVFWHNLNTIFICNISNISKIDCDFLIGKGKINQLDGKINQLNRKHDYIFKTEPKEA